MAFAGGASASTLTSPAGTSYTGTLKASSTNVTLTNMTTFGTIRCSQSESEGNVTKHGAGGAVVGDITKLTLTECTGGKPTDPVVKTGTFDLHFTSTPNGTVTSLGAEVVFHETLVGTAGSFGDLAAGEQLRRGDPDHAPFEALSRPVDDPGGVDFPDLKLQAQVARVLL